MHLEDLDVPVFGIEAPGAACSDNHAEQVDAESLILPDLTMRRVAGGGGDRGIGRLRSSRWCR